MRKTSFIAIVGVIAVAGFGLAQAEDQPEHGAKDSGHTFVGVAKCKTCHNTAKSGMQFKKWTETKHSQAFLDLATPAAKEMATNKKLGDPQKEPACLQCHVTGYGKPAARFAATFKPEDGVQCETCHGAGADYMKMSVMKGLKAGTVSADTTGLVMPTKEVCVTCHNDQSPTFKAFDFTADSTKIAHPEPKAEAAK